MSNVPTNLIPTRITGLPEYQGSSTLGFMPYVIDGRTYKVQFSNIAAVGAVPSTRVIATGNGLEGGGDLSQDRTISIISHGVGYSQLDFTGVVAGTYGSASTIPAITVDDTGRVTSAVDTPVVLSGYVPSSRTVTAGAGLTGGGQLNGNITISLNPSNATPQPLGAASAGFGVQAAREDHVHPAVDLTDTTETQGVLPLGRGGTGDALSPVVGAVIYADNNSLNQTTAGNAGQILKSAGGSGAPYWDDLSAGGTVTSVSVATANGLAGTVADPTVAPIITLSTTVTGMVKANGTALSAALAATDYVAPGAYTTSGLVMATGRLLGRSASGSGAAEEISIGTGLSLSVGSLVNTAPDQVVSLTGAGTTIISGTYPTFTITSNDQYTGTVTSVAGTGTVSGISLSGTVTTNGSLTLGGALDLSAPPTIGNATPNSGAFTGVTANTVLLAANPTLALQAATKQYVDTLVSSGITYHTPVKYEVPNTTGNLNALYNQPGGAGVGVGATLTNNGTKAPFAPDGPTASVGDRILVYNQTNAFENGIYEVTTVGTSDPGGTNWVLTRTTDADTYALKSPTGLGSGDAFFITSGNTGAGETYVMNATGVITFGTSAITFVQVSDATLYTAGTGLTLDGTEFSITPVGTAGVYGSASQVPVITTNASGQVSGVVSTSIAIAGSQITSGSVAIAQGGTGQTTAGAAFNALSPITATGDLIIGNGTNSATRLGIGANSYVLTSDGTTAAWAAPTVNVASISFGSTGLTPATATTGAVTVSGTLNVSNGGTGATTYTDGQLLIGNSTGNTLTKATLTAGTNVSITNGAGSITINATDQYVGTVTSVSALTLGTTGTDLSSTVANSTTTPVITLNVPTASASNRGALSSTDWSTFNGKQAALVSGSNIKTVSGTTLLGSGDVGTIGVAYGGTGQTSYTDGQLLIGDSSGNTLAKSTLTAGTGVTITNGPGSITISAPGSTGTVTSVSGTGTVNGITLTGTVTSSGSLTLGGTLSGVNLTSQVTGTLPVANGGTGVTTYGTATVATFNTGTAATWTPPAGAKFVKIEVWGGGGSGGNSNIGTSTAGGGGGGAYNTITILLSQVSSLVYTVGSGGTAVTGGTNGNPGGNSSVVLGAYNGGSDVTIYAYGGGGGQYSTAGSNGGGGGGIQSAGSATAGGEPGITSTGAGSVYGGGFGSYQLTPTRLANPSVFGGGAGGQGADTAAAAGHTGGTSYYGGGGGGGMNNSGSTPGAGGTSVFGGSGGAAVSGGNGTAGTAPSGGGGANYNGTNSGAGAAGRVQFTWW